MEYKIILKCGTEKIIEAKDLDEAEIKAPKTWVDIILMDKTKGIIVKGQK